MDLIETSIRRPIAIAMIFLVILFTGFFSATHLPLEITPNVEFPQLTITVSWPYTSPEVMEAFVTAPLEAVANTIRGVQKVTSSSSEGNSQVTLQFSRGTDMEFAKMELSEKLSMVREELPHGVSPPSISRYEPRKFRTGRFFSIRLTGPYTINDLRSIALDRIRPYLLGIKGVANVTVIGGQDREIEILVDKHRLDSYGLSLYSIAAVLNELGMKENIGAIDQGGTRQSIFIDTPIKDADEISNAIIKTTKDGGVVRIKDVAQVFDTFGRARSLSRINGNPAVVINIDREIGTNIVSCADRIMEKLDVIKDRLPANLTMIVDDDQSREIRDNLSSLAQKSLFSVVVIFLVLMIFLHTYRSPIIIISTIFFSVLMSLNLFLIFKITLNLLTLAGLTLGFGMLVDNAIVVVENIIRRCGGGERLIDSAIHGTKEVVLPIMASTLTTVVAFLPFLYMTGELRIYYLPFAMAVGFSLLSSIVVAFSLTPSLTARFFSEEELAVEKIRVFKPLGWFKRTLSRMVDHRGVVLSVLLILLGFSYYIFDRYVTKGRIWSGWGRREVLYVGIRLPKGAELERTDKIIRKFENIALKKNFVEKISTNVYDESASMRIKFPEEVLSTSFPYILKEELIGVAAQMSGIDVSIYGFGEPFSIGSSYWVMGNSIKILGYNYDRIKKIAHDIGKRLRKYVRVKNVNEDMAYVYSYGNSYETVLSIDREKLMKYDITILEVLYNVSAFLRENLGAQRVRMGGDEIGCTIKFKTYKDFSMMDLKNLLIPTKRGEGVRLGEVALITKRKTMEEILRENQQYMRYVGFEFRGPQKLCNRLIESIINTTHVPPGYSVDNGRSYRMSKKEKNEIFFILGISLLLVFLVTAGLFESILHPFLILLTVPFSLSGVFLIFYLTGTSFDRSAYIGVILLGGIVVNDSIILIDHINRLRREGLSIKEAVINGTSNRMRPILMTTFTTIGGLLPLVILGSESGDIWYALALATIGGLIASTVMVLTVIPVLYVTFEKISIKFKRLSI